MDRTLRKTNLQLTALDSTASSDCHVARLARLWWRRFLVKNGETNRGVTPLRGEGRLRQRNNLGLRVQAKPSVDGFFNFGRVTLEDLDFHVVSLVVPLESPSALSRLGKLSCGGVTGQRLKPLPCR